MSSPRSFILSFFLLLIVWSRTPAQQEQRFQRLRCHHERWQTFHTPFFHLYFPSGYDSAAQFLAGKLPAAMKQTADRMGGTSSKEPQIILYPSVDQLYESNIGSTLPLPATLPTWIGKGNRVLLAFTGDYRQLEADLNEALCQGIWNSWFSEGIDQQLSGTVQQSGMPEWFREGAIRYFANGWSVEAEAACTRALTDSSFALFCMQQPALAGAAFCYYLTQEYYPEAAKQLLYQVRAKRSLARATRLITQRPLEQVLAACRAFYRQRLDSSTRHMQVPGMDSLKLQLPPGRLLQVLSSEDKGSLVLLLETGQERTVYSYLVSTRKTTRIFRYGLPPWISGHEQDRCPLLNLDDGLIQITCPVKGKLLIQTYDLQGRRQYRLELPQIDGVAQAERQTEEKKSRREEWLLSAWRMGQSDLVRYDPARSRYTPLTNDIASDGFFYREGEDEDLVFESDRQATTDTGKAARHWPGIYRLHGEAAARIIADTTDYVHWTHPLALPDGQLLCRTTVAGRQQYALLAPNGSYHLLDAHTPAPAFAHDQAITWSVQKDTLRLYRQPLPPWLEAHWQTDPVPAPWLEDHRKTAARRAREDSILAAARDTTASFLSGVLGSNRETARRQQDSLNKLQQYDPKKVRPYALQLYSAYFSAQVNNDYYINRYQPYQNYQGQFQATEAGALVQGGFSDLFENHRFNIGYRLPAGSDGSDFFVSYRNATHRLEWGLTYFRKVEQLQPDPERNWTASNGNLYPNAGKVKTHYYELNLHAPLSWYSAIDFTTAVRYDRTIFTATDLYSLKAEDLRQPWSVNTIAYRIDKRTPTITGLYRGFYGHAGIDGFSSIKGAGGTTFGLQGLVEYHQPLYQHITLAGRLQGGYSLGTGRILYNFGGTEGNLVIRADSTVHFPQQAPYVFQTLVMPFRGYLQNSLYGDRYGLLNLDVYFPLSELLRISTAFPSLNTLQLGLFSDLATASEHYRGAVPKDKGPMLASYGFSARTILAGYPIRFDMAWPSAGGKPVWYLSLKW